MGTSIVADIPRSPAVHACEQASCTLVEGTPYVVGVPCAGGQAELVCAEAGRAARSGARSHAFAGCHRVRLAHPAVSSSLFAEHVPRFFRPGFARSLG